MSDAPKTSQLKNKISKRHYLVAFALLIAAGIGAGIYFSQHKTRQQLQVTPISKASALSLPDSDPTELIIPKINVDAGFEKLGLQSNGAVEVPKDPWKVGWYQYASTPGHLGPAVVLGHLDSATGPAVFYKLKDLAVGDEIDVKRADGKTAVFKVSEIESYALKDFPNDKVYGPIDYAGLRLITCEGTYSRSAGHYSENRVVYAYLDSVK